MNGVIKACAHGSFHLTKLTSNSRDVLQTIPVGERAKELRSLDLDHDCLPIEQALGVHWVVEFDSIGFRITTKDKLLTRRGILSTVGSIYDPLGIAASVLLPGKKILQDLCREKMDWDDEIPDEYRNHWEKWKSSLPLIEKFSMDRCLKPANFGRIVSQEVRSFSDARSTRYRQVSYLRQENDQGDVHCAFLTGKARLTPTKPITILCHELTTAVLSVCVTDMLVREMDNPPDTRFYWTDSTTVPKYINNERVRHKIFAANHVQMIRDIMLTPN